MWAGCPHPACRSKARVEDMRTLVFKWVPSPRMQEQSACAEIKRGGGTPPTGARGFGCGRGALTPHSTWESFLHSDAALHGRLPFYDVIRSGLYLCRVVRDLGMLNPV